MKNIVLCGSMKVKNEILDTSFSETELLACLSGFIRNNIEITENHIYFANENLKLMEFLKNQLERILDISIAIEVKENKNLEKVGYQHNQVYLENPPLYFIDGNAEIRAYLKGVFLARGSINDPKTSRYHMEILIEQPQEAIFVQKLLNLFDLNAKLLNRDKGYMIYIKEAECISDFLKLIGAMNAVLYYEDIRIYRNQKNYTNRLNNCEQANVDKVIETAMEQLKAIEVIEKYMGVDLLDEKLAEIISYETRKPITKSGLSHRFRKIKELAKKLSEQVEK